MKFGKQILAEQIPGWSPYYLDYKALKKIVSSLANAAPVDGTPTGPAPENGLARSPVLPLVPSALAAATPERPAIDQTLHLLPTTAIDEDRGPRFQAIKTNFFFKLERELEKINSFYLQKEAELKLRLETLLSKRRAAAARILPDDTDTTPKDHAEWKAVEEGFRVLGRDLAKLQQFVDINATGFRKILKKWDKRSKSTTKELYLARQVEVQPVFNRQLIAELSDIVASCLMDLTDLSVGLTIEGSTVNDLMLAHQIALERIARTAPFHDLETNLLTAIQKNEEPTIRDLVRQSDTLSEQGGKAHVTRILWKAIIEAPVPLADYIITSAPFDFTFVDDINGRTCLHEAASTGELRLVDICLEKGVQIHKMDIYGRNALHYAAMNGHAAVCRRLISIGIQPTSLDLDNFTPLIYAIVKTHLECVRVLLDDGHVNVEPATAAGDMIPLSLACQVGSVDIVLVLLQHGAKSVPNTNGEYPIHLAAKEGHAEICRLLRNIDGWDMADKYNEWTPLFHAARYGHEACVKILLELGSRVWPVDETGKHAIFYACWYGHLGCAKLLLDYAPAHHPITVIAARSPQISPFVENEPPELDLDTIPSLSLPPPIMPYRIYGHNYLDNIGLVQVSVGHPFSRYSSQTPAVQLVPRMVGPTTSLLPQTSPLFKLVMTSKPDIPSAPYSVSIPVRDEKDVLTFQTANLDALTLEFSVYPNFGTKTIGRAVVLPSLLRTLENGQPVVLPILDHHLHVIGEVAVEVNIITPFRGVTLQIGGAVETYWKSQAMPFIPPPPRRAHVHGRQPSFTSSSAFTSPSNSLAGPNGHALTFSSLSGEYIHIHVQVTRDLKPIVFDRWKLPVEEYDLGVAELTLEQVQRVVAKQRKKIHFGHYQAASPSQWHRVLSDSMISLEELMKDLPPSLGVYIDLAYPTATIKQQYNLGRHHDPNEFVDAILRVVYQSSLEHSRRRIVFGSSSPTICAAVNWKQPNYPVFFASQCGIHNLTRPSFTTLGPAEADDRRLSSIHSAVEWAKTNNLLGVFVAAELLGKVPELVQGVKDNGLLLGVYGGPLAQQEQALAGGSLSPVLHPEVAAGVDAAVQEGVVSFIDHAGRGLL